MRHCVVSNYLKVMVEVQTTSTTVPTRLTLLNGGQVPEIMKRYEDLRLHLDLTLQCITVLCQAVG